LLIGGRGKGEEIERGEIGGGGGIGGEVTIVTTR